MNRYFHTALLATLLFASHQVRAEAPGPFQIGRWIQQVPRHSVLAEPGYYVWGGSVVEDGGKYHMFYSRWPVSGWTFGDGWLFASEICHAVADNPGGPFVPTGVVLGKRANDPAMAYWDSQTQHNPHIRKFGGKFYLYYMASVDPGPAVWPAPTTQRNRIQRNQRIGVIAADSIQDFIAGNFTRPATPIIAPVYSTSQATDRSTNPTDFSSNRIVNNQTVIERPDGKFQIIFKSNWPQSPSYGHGYALADDPAGPFTQVPGPIFSDQGREDENHWYDASRGKYFLICKNFNAGGTEQLESADSVTWTSSGTQFGRFIPWADGTVEFMEALERPQLLRNANGVPIMLYMAARRALPGGAKETFNVHIPLAQGAANAFPLTGPQDIRTSGVPIQAVNLGATAPVTLNGLTFAPSGTSTSALATNYGFTQTGGSGASLSAGLIETAYDAVPAFEDFLDTMAWQSGTPQAGAALSFQLSGLTPGRTYRLQLFLAEARAGTPSRHGPQMLVIGGKPQPIFDFGPAAKLIDGAATALRVEAVFIATAATAPVQLLQQVTGGGALQLSAFAVHDVSPPEGAAVEYPSGGTPAVAWTVVPGFRYTVEVSLDLADWLPAPGGTYEPAGAVPLRIVYQDPAPVPGHRFYRLLWQDASAT